MSDVSSFDIRIYYEDTDLGGVVYYANYLKFFERARTEFLRQKGINQSQLLADENLIFVVRNCNISYKKPAKFDDLITITTQIESYSAISMIMKQEMFLENNLLNSLQVKIAAIDAISKRPKKMSESLLNKIIL